MLRNCLYHLDILKKSCDFALQYSAENKKKMGLAIENLTVVACKLVSI